MITKGVILAGGSGTRLRPATLVTNKHLLPIYDKPMIYYPINTLLDAGIKDILIICGPEHAGDFAQLLGDGSDFNACFTYRVQGKALGIANAIGLSEGFANGGSIAAILGDNLFEDNFKEQISTFDGGAHIFLKEVRDAERFGVAEIDDQNNVLSIEEKPKNPKTNFAVTGLYLYENSVFRILKECGLSERGEYEITDVNNIFIKEKLMSASFVQGNWTDAGTHESFHRAAVLARQLKLNS